MEFSIALLQFAVTVLGCFINDRLPLIIQVKKKKSKIYLSAINIDADPLNP